jgi:type I restriction enzyme M protein
LKAADETEHGMTIYGQENDNATAALAKMNMILHNYPTAEIKQDNTLANPLFLNADGSLKSFDYVVANPPFSFKSWSSGLHPQDDFYGRFKGYGIPPEKNGDYAFLLHIIPIIEEYRERCCYPSARCALSGVDRKRRSVPTLLNVVT